MEAKELGTFNYGIMLKNLRTWENFSWARYGDGEWEAMLKAKHPKWIGRQRVQNCDRHTYFQDMGEELFKIVNKPQRYYMGLQNLGKSMYNDKISRMLGTQYKKIQWCESDTLHHASMAHELDMLFSALSDREVIFVANEFLGKLKKFKFTHIQIPDKNCWNDRDRILKEVLDKAKDDSVILWCASMPTEVLMDRVFDEWGNRLTQIDAGSVFDPYVGRKIRRYHQTLKI